VLCALAIALLPLVLGDTHEYRFAFVASYFIAALGLQLLTGFAGQISIGHSGFMMLGAYTTLILSVDHGWRDLWTIPVAGAISGAIGFLFGFPALRLRGVYLALATFAIPIAMIALAKKFDTFTGGGGGKPLDRVLTGHEAYVTAWPIAGAMFVLAWLVVRGRLGRALRTVRESEIAAVYSGINLALTKTVAFGISAFYAGVGGSLFAITIGFVNPDPFGIALSILLLTGVVVGGLGSLSGVIVGALFIEYIPLYSPDILAKAERPFGLHLDPKTAGAPAVVYGVILLIVLYLFPSGVAGILRAGLRFAGRESTIQTTKPTPQVSSPRREA
jgi:branched-chain amino acid transport system permease protein